MADAPAPDGAAPPGNPDGRRSRVNFTLKPSPATSHTQGLLDRSIGIMERNGVSVDVVRAVDLDLPPGVYPGMREHGFESDGWRAPAGRTTTSPTGTDVHELEPHAPGRMLRDASGVPKHGNQRSEWEAGCRFDFENPEYR